MITVAGFVTRFPEFSNTTTYPASTVQFWIDVAQRALNPRRYADMLDLATALFVAHAITLAAKNVAAAANGLPGQTSGPLASKGAGGLSASYDTTSGTEPGAGWLNLTSYGVQLYGLMQIAGMGGIQI